MPTATTIASNTASVIHRSKRLRHLVRHYIPQTLDSLHVSGDPDSKETVRRITCVMFQDIHFKVNIKPSGQPHVPDLFATGRDLYQTYHEAGRQSLLKGYSFPEETMAQVFICFDEKSVQIHPEDVQSVLIFLDFPVIPIRNLFWL